MAERTGKAGRAGKTGGISFLHAHDPSPRWCLPFTFPPLPSFPPFPSLLILLLAAGCFFGKTPETASDSDWSADVPLHIVNNHWLDVTIYVIHDGQRSRLGVAGGTAETQMVLPHRMLGMGGSIQLYGDPIGSSEEAITEVLKVQPGQFIEWSLEWSLERSSVGVF